MYAPVYCGDMTERTEILVAYDETYVYVAGRLYDSEPSLIRANSLYRDRYSSDDTFAIIIDAFNDNENALWFFTTPNGVRFDMAVDNDAEGRPNSSWNTYWDAAAVVTDEGWFAEMRIPLSSLGFQEVEGGVVMGLSTYRFIARKNERHVFPAIPPNWNMGWAKPSQARKVSLEGVRSHRPLYITPYGLAGADHVAELSEDESGYATDTDQSLDVGGDLKYSLTSNATLDLTVNTDFAQVEADDQQVNLTRFSLFFPEKRQFFQERAATFEYSIGRADRLFHSRQIGLYEDQEVPIYGGARVVGRLGGWDVGVLNMQTAALDPLPSENFGVYRVRRQVFNVNSYAGGMVTTRLGADGGYNLAYGLDGIFRTGTRDYLTVQWSQTFDDAIIDSAGFDFGKSLLARVLLERRGQEGFSYMYGLTYRGLDYEPGIGFIQRTGSTNPFVRLAYGWFPGGGSRIRLIQPDVVTDLHISNDDGSLESAFVNHEWEIEAKSGDSYGFEVSWEQDVLTDSLEYPNDAWVAPGRHRFTQVSGRYEMREGRLFRFRAEVGAGGLYDGKGVVVAARPTWNISKHLELSADYEFTHIRFADRDEGFDIHLARLRAQIGFNSKASIAAFVQVNSASNLLAANLRFRYNFRENNDLWIVFNQGVNTDRQGQMPVPPRTDYRTVAVKYTHTFRL
jgi:hypothetical protein